MIFAILIYFIVVLIVIKLCGNKKFRYFKLPKLYMDKTGIFFYSTKRHRIRIDDAKFIKINNVVFLKKNNKQIEIHNIENINYKDGYLYFTAKGKCKIWFNAKVLSKYFNIKIKSDVINVEKVKNKALDEIINNLLNLNSCKTLKEYIKTIKEILKIKISDKQIKIEQNQFKIPFILEYMLNGTKKIVKVNNF